jgi:hypothetical protein
MDTLAASLRRMGTHSHWLRDSYFLVWPPRPQKRRLRRRYQISYSHIEAKARPSQIAPNRVNRKDAD